jgi:HNH endonuclease
MASGDRFYQLELRHRPALHGDVGSILKIEGIVISGEDAQAVFMLPDCTLKPSSTYHRLTTEEWSDWLQRSDDPEVLVNGSLEKAFHRKLRYDISGMVQQRVWAADGFKCVYCGRKMGTEAQLTIDHWVPLEMGGANDPSNYLSADKRCNKRKGGMSPQQWCQQEGLDFKFYVDYLSSRRI